MFSDKLRLFDLRDALYIFFLASAQLYLDTVHKFLVVGCVTPADFI